MAHEHHDHAHDHDHDHAGHDHGIGHVVPFKILAGVAAALLTLTVITVVVARMDFGNLNLIIALAIATLKASLVALFFMHLRWDRPFHAVIVVAGIFAALLFVSFAFMDGNQYQRDICAQRGASCEIWQDMVKKQQTSPTPGRVSTPSPTPPPIPAPAGQVAPVEGVKPAP